MRNLNHPRLSGELCKPGPPAFLSVNELFKTSSPVHVEIGGQKVSIFHKEDALTAWAENKEGELLSGVLVYNHGWLDFFPESEIFSAKTLVRKDHD